MMVSEQLIVNLPEPDAARRFIDQLAEKTVTEAERLCKNEALLSDVLTLVSFSPLLATTLLHNPDYLWWLDRKRRDTRIRGRDELLESFARFSISNPVVEPHVLFA